MWRYRYRLYRTDQHRTGTGTDNYRYSNGHGLGVYWFIRGAKWIYIQERWIVSAGRLTVRVAGMLVWPTRDPCVGGEGEVQVTSIETQGEPDAGWLAATLPYFKDIMVYILRTTHLYWTKPPKSSMGNIEFWKFPGFQWKISFHVKLEKFPVYPGKFPWAPLPRK